MQKISRTKKNLCNVFQVEMTITDFVYVAYFLLKNNDNRLKLHNTIQQKKIDNICIEQFPKENPFKITFNLLSQDLSNFRKFIKGFYQRVEFLITT